MDASERRLFELGSADDDRRSRAGRQQSLAVIGQGQGSVLLPTPVPVAVIIGRQKVRGAAGQTSRRSVSRTQFFVIPLVFDHLPSVQHVSNAGDEGSDLAPTHLQRSLATGQGQKIFSSVRGNEITT